MSVEELAREGFGVAETGRKVIEIVVQGHMESSIRGGDVGDSVESCEEGRCGGEVGEPGWRGAARTKGTVETRGSRARIDWFEGVDGRWLDAERVGCRWGVHGCDDHRGDLTGNNVIGNAVRDR